MTAQQIFIDLKFNNFDQLIDWLKQHSEHFLITEKLIGVRFEEDAPYEIYAWERKNNLIYLKKCEENT